YDTDLFRVSSRVVGDLNIVVNTDNSDLNPRIQVFDSNRNLIAGESDDTNTASQVVHATAANQTFYILVLPDTAGGGMQIGSYSVTVSQNLGGGGGGGPDDNPNAGDYGAATPINLDARTGDASVAGVINYAGDTDLFRFTTATYQPGVGMRPVYLQITTPQ